MDKIRAKLLERGTNGIMEFGRSFKVMDKNRSQSLDLDEFTNLVEVYRIGLTDNEIRQVFQSIDTDCSNKLSYKEFLVALRPPMSKTRASLVDQAFSIIDATGDGVITIEDLELKYSVEHHPKYISGEMTKAQCLRKFLDNFDNENCKDGVVTRDEWHDYYSGVSAFIDSDNYFVEMMKKSWKL